MAEWIDFADNGRRRHLSDGRLSVKFLDVGDARIFRFEDEVDVASGMGGTVDVVRVSYVAVPYDPDRKTDR